MNVPNWDRNTHKVFDILLKIHLISLCQNDIQLFS